MIITRRTLSRLLLGGVSAAAALRAAAAQSPRRAATVHKSPGCDCCEGYAAYLRANGFDVTVIESSDLEPINREHGVPAELEGCHATLMAGYLVGGHVPIRTVERLLAERPAIRAITLPGMPLGSPGMGGRQVEPFTIYAIADGAPRVYAVE